MNRKDASERLNPRHQNPAALRNPSMSEILQSSLPTWLRWYLIAAISSVL
jgi:hypothetical protein